MFDQIVKFIRELYGNKKIIPLHSPYFDKKEKEFVLKTIESSFVSSVGEYVKLFEKEIAQFTSAKFATATVNGTSALHIALILANVAENDEVITQPLTFVATVNAIKYVRANPVFIDIDKDTLGLSPEKLSKFLKSNCIFKKGCTYNKTTKRKISVCIPMHTFGHPCRIDEIASICRNYNISLIEDAAESLGSFYKNQHTGTFGLIGIFSFNGNKIITTGGGGAIVTNNEKLAQKAKHLTTTAKIPHPWEYVHDQIGFNYRMPNINASLGCAQMSKLKKFLKIKRKIAKTYSIFFKKLNIQFIEEPPFATSNYWLNAILLTNRRERDAFLEYSNKKGICTRPAWRLMNQLKMFKSYQTDNLDNAKFIADRLVNIPSSVNYE